MGHPQQQLQRMACCDGRAFYVRQQETGIALDAVDTPKEGVQVVLRRRIAFQRERVRLDSFQVVLAFHHEQFERLRRYGTKQGHRRSLVLQQPDAQFAFVLDEHEHVPDRGLIAVRDQEDVPPEIALLRFQRRQRRYLVGMGGDVGLSEFPQLIEQRYRIGAGVENLAVRLEDDLECPANFRRFRRFPAWRLKRNFRRRQQFRERGG